MAAVGDGRDDSASLYTAAGVTRAHSPWFKPMFGEAYIRELEHFIECARTGTTPAVTGQDGRESLRMARAAIESVQTGRAVPIGA
jgi:myo-inositol 2-dehydrogenase/D-chiro-inositol 1-dehydrogenase